MNGATIFRDLLPSLCRTLDRTRPYWRSTPWGKGFPNDESNGNHHQWEVWSGWKDYTEYERNRARFVTEFGFQAPANTATFESVTRPSDRYAQSAVLEHHNKQIEGTERLFRFQAAHYEITGDLEGFIYKGQLVQAQALKTAVEHWRRRMFSTAGVLFWQLNDCWPISSWAVVDSALRPKAAFYYARRFFSPVLVSFRKRETLVEVWTTNDTTTRIHANVEVALMSWKGKRVWSRVLRATVAPNASRKLLDVEVARVRSFDPGEQYLRARVVRDGEILAENRLLFREPKHLRFPTAALRIEAAQLNDRQTCLTVRADAFVKDVFLTVDGSDAEFEDNYYDLDARTSKRIVVTSGLTAKELVNTLKVRWLQGDGGGSRKSEQDIMTQIM
jgi:beta-mannosidase